MAVNYMGKAALYERVKTVYPGRLPMLKKTVYRRFSGIEELRCDDVKVSVQNGGAWLHLYVYEYGEYGELETERAYSDWNTAKQCYDYKGNVTKWLTDMNGDKRKVDDDFDVSLLNDYEYCH